MTLIKSILLGSAAGIVAVASAEAADLPTRKGPVAAEYVRVCSITVAGVPVVGFVLPGSDTCFKLSGYVTGQITGGNLKTGYRTSVAGLFGGGETGGNTSTQAIVGNFGRDSFGFTTRYNQTFDAVSNTAYGPLVAHAELQFNHSEGFDNTGRAGSDGGLNRAYVTWAGLTAGKAGSFFSFTGGGPGWANFFSSDRKGFDQPDLLAYTASFGGGFSATLSAESSAHLEDNSGGQSFLGSATWGGMRFPDIVGALDVSQSWGSAHVAGVAHNVRASSNVGDPNLDTWGWGVNAGVLLNFPSVAGAQIGLTGSWSQSAIVASGLPDGMWGEQGCVNGNGQCSAYGDAFSNGNGTWAKPEAWTVTGWTQFNVNPQVTLAALGSYGEIRWTNTPAITMLSTSKSFIVGGVAHYDPVKNLDFEFELLYQGTTTARPTGYIAGNGVTTTSSWQSDADGFAARLEVTRSF